MKKLPLLVFHSPEDETLLIKRVIGIPGDLVAMQNNQLFLNEEPVLYKADLEDIGHVPEHTFLTEVLGPVEHPVMLRNPGTVSNSSFAPVVVPEGQYLVLGDNRDNSRDSRWLGLIPRERITGRAHTIAFSVNYDAYYLPRPDRFLQPLQ